MDFKNSGFVYTILYEMHSTIVQWTLGMCKCIVLTYFMYYTYYTITLKFLMTTIKNNNENNNKNHIRESLLERQ